MRIYLLIPAIATLLSGCNKDKTSGNVFVEFNRNYTTLEQLADFHDTWDCSGITCTEKGVQCELMQAKIFVNIYKGSSLVNTHYVAKYAIYHQFSDLNAGKYTLEAIAYAPYLVPNSDSTNSIAYACETQIADFEIIDNQTTNLVLDTLWND